MRKKLGIGAVVLLFLSAVAHAVDIKISQLPLGSATTSGGADSFPYVQSATNVTKRLNLWDISNLPTIVSTYAPKANPVFTGTVTAPTFVGSLTGVASGNELPLTFSAPLARATNTISIPVASGSTNGYLSSTNWNTFNNKQASGNYITDLAGGDVTASGPGSVVATLASSISGAKTFSTSLTSPEFQSSTANPAGAGVVRLANLDYIKWRNAANSADLGVRLDSSNIFQFGAAVNSSGTVTGSNLSGTNSGDVTLGAVGSSPSTSGASLSGQVLTLQPFDSTRPGVVTASGGGSSNFLRADGTWAAPASSSATTLTPSTKTANYTIDSTDNVKMLIADTTSSSFTFTFPAASGMSGLPIHIVKIGNNTLTLARTGSDLIMGETSQTINVPYTTVVFYSDGSAAYYSF